MKTTINNLTIEQITSAYSGTPGKCCCGCAGKHYHMQAKGDYRGGGTRNDLRQIKRILDIVKASIDVEDLGEAFAAEVEGRLYIVYTN